MADRENDPAATTQQFRAFAKRGDGTEAKSSRMTPGVIVGSLGALAVVLLVFAVLLINL